jgi:hypothetical protein
MFDLNKEEMVKALKQIIADGGTDIFADKDRFRAFYKDYMCNEKDGMKHIIRIMSDTETAKHLIYGINTPSDVSRVQMLIKRELTQGLFMDENRANFFVEVFCEALGWEANSQTSPPKQPTVSSQPATQPKPKSTGNISVGSIINFGKYEWRVLDVQDRQALVISEYVLEKRPYHAQDVNITWADCSLRQNLNGEFLDKFSASDKAKIISTPIATLNNPRYGTSGGESVTDSIFLLSLKEVCRYFGDSMAELKKVKKDKYVFNDKNSQNRIAKFVQSDELWWWLRSPGDNSDSTADVSNGGGVNVNGNIVDDDFGVRPALWLKIDEI